MTHGHRSHGGGAFSLIALVGAVAFAFGIRTARIVVGSALLVGTAFFGYVMFRVVMGTL